MTRPRKGSTVKVRVEPRSSALGGGRLTTRPAVGSFTRESGEHWPIYLSAGGHLTTEVVVVLQVDLIFNLVCHSKRWISCLVCQRKEVDSFLVCHIKEVGFPF